MTMITATPSPVLRERTLAVLSACATAAASLDGAILELGVGGGATASHLADIAVQFRKQLILIDPFEPLPVTLWQEVDGTFAAREMNHFHRPVGEVIGLVDRDGLDLSVRVGLVNEVRFKESLCFAHVDVDLYESTASAIQLVSQWMHYCGVMVVDDYGDPLWPGVKAAVDEYLSKDGWYAYTVEGFHQLVAVRL